jgi:cytochrome b561
VVRNTETSYGSITKWMHWLTALFILIAYVSIYYLHWVLNDEGPLRSPIIQLHKAIGFSILIFIILRLYWRTNNPHPALPDRLPKWQVKAANASHFMLYLLLIVTPVSGYLGNTAGINYGLFNIPSLKEAAIFVEMLGLFDLSYDQFEVPFDFFHYQVAGPLIVWMTVAVHISAGLYHHFVEKDVVLKRMLPGNLG